MLPKNVETKAIVGSRERRLYELFLYALRQAENVSVLFLSKRVIDEIPQELMSNHALKTNKDILRRITFAYPENWNEVIGKCSEVHTWRSVPGAIVLDGLDEYIDCQSFSYKSQLLCAALVDATAACARATKATARLFVSIDGQVYATHEKFLSVLLDTYFYRDVQITNTT